MTYPLESHSYRCSSSTTMWSTTSVSSENATSCRNRTRKANTWSLILVNVRYLTSLGISNILRMTILEALKLDFNQIILQITSIVVFIENC